MIAQRFGIVSPAAGRWKGELAAAGHFAEDVGGRFAAVFGSHRQGRGGNLPGDFLAALFLPSLKNPQPPDLSAVASVGGFRRRPFPRSLPR